MVGGMERRYSDGYEAARGWTGHSQKGYVSFPDYEKYFPEDEAENREAAYKNHYDASQDVRRRAIGT
jgi:hypothetical protein